MNLLPSSPRGQRQGGEKMYTPRLCRINGSDARSGEMSSHSYGEMCYCSRQVLSTPFIGGQPRTKRIVGELKSIIYLPIQAAYITISCVFGLFQSRKLHIVGPSKWHCTVKPTGIAGWDRCREALRLDKSTLVKKFSRTFHSTGSGN